MMYLGHDSGYWLALDERIKKQPDGLVVEDLLTEIVSLRGRLSFLESRILEAAKAIK